jgi:hypothetical protein
MSCWPIVKSMAVASAPVLTSRQRRCTSWQEAEQEGEQPGGHNERDEHADATPQQRDARGVAGEPAVQRGKGGRHGQRNHQQKADRHYQAFRFVIVVASTAVFQTEQAEDGKSAIL